MAVDMLSSLENQNKFYTGLAIPILILQIHMTPGKLEMYEGKYDDKCTVDDFLSHMPTSSACHEVFRQKKRKRLRVFWYPDAQTDYHCRNILTAAKMSDSGRSVQEKIKCFLELLPIIVDDDEYMMVQFWTPKKSSTGRTVLTVSEQPFAVSRLYKGLCRYRYHCIQHEIDLIDEVKVGPIGRVFNLGSHEYCQNIESYTIQEFPIRNFAKYCGFKQYHAFPLLKHGDGEQQCIGVLEYLSRSESIFYHSLFPESLEDMPDSKTAGSHFLERFKVRKHVFESTLSESMLKFVRSKYGLPLIQIWAPCLSGAQLFCHCISFDWKLDGSKNYDYLVSFYGAHSVKNGRGLIGKAYSQTKCCFFKDTSRFSISDYPLVHITRSLNLTACLAIPLQSIHPEIHPLIIQAFLPPQQNYDHANVEDVLRSILSTVAQELSRSEEFHVEFSNSDEEDFVFFDVHRSCRTSYSTVIEEGHHFEVLQSAPPYRFEEAFLDDIPIELTVENFDGEQYHIHEILRDNLQPDATLEARDHSMFIPEATVEASGEDFANGDAEIALESIPGGEEVEVARKIHEMKGIEDMDDDSRKTCMTDEDEITLDIINQYRGRRAKLADVAKELKVSRSTLKRRCRKFGIKRWPYYKKNEVHNIQSSIEDGYHEINQGYRLIVKARCGDDTAKFPFYSNSGIEELRRELVKRFELEAGRFKMKYKDDEDDDGEWIILSCNEDLLFHMETLKASGQSTMRLSVFPLTL